MNFPFTTTHALRLSILWMVACVMLAQVADAQEANPATKQAIVEFDAALASAKEGTSEARQRLTVRRVIRDAEKLVESLNDDPNRFFVIEFIFRARQQLVSLDDDTKYRDALLETCRELVKAPDQYSGLRLEADLLLSQAELAKKGANAEARAEALRPFVQRYIDTPSGAKVLRLAMILALELGDIQLINDLREIMAERFSANLEMITFQRDRLGGQVFGAPFSGHYKRSDGKTVCFPMDGLGRTTMLLFWSKEDNGLNMLKGIAAASLEKKEKISGRIEIVSFNLDDLPDAGESIIRGLGVDWQVLHLPAGRENPIYDAFVRQDPRNVRVSPTGLAALIMSESGRKKLHADDTVDYDRVFRAALARNWTQPRYVMHLSALMAGDFLILDPMGGIDPTRPAELKAAAMGKVSQPLTRDSSCVPEAILRVIQDSFVAPPMRYRISHEESRASYSKVVELCRQAIADHPHAPDLWIVRNRLIVALLGLWKTDSDLGQLEAAIAEAKAALTAGYPSGCDLIARFCLAREALRDPKADAKKVIQQFVVDSGGESAPGAAFAVASLLALDVADRQIFKEFRKIILEQRTESPMMWTYSAFLLDSYHDYWLFQVPFTAGRSFHRREDYFLSKGDADEAKRMLTTELRTSEGTPMRIPEDLNTRWTMLVFSKPAPWQQKRDEELPPPPDATLRHYTNYAASRPGGDVKVMLAILGDEAKASREFLNTKKVDCQILTLPGGVDNPLIHRLGILSEDEQINSVLIGEGGRIATVISGLAKGRVRSDSTMFNLIEREDEKSISAAFERGEVEAAKERILALAPPFDPEAVDDRGRKLKEPKYSLAHLRARARVYMALEEWDNALADAEEVVQRQLRTDGGMSLRTDELNESEALRDSILKRIEPKAGL